MFIENLYVYKIRNGFVFSVVSCGYGGRMDILIPTGQEFNPELFIASRTVCGRLCLAT